MVPITRVNDVSIGICSIGAKCCPHTWVSIHINGSDLTFSENLNIMRVGDIGISTCPHCPISIAISGSSLSYDQNIQIHRLNDVHIVPCGTGIVVTASNLTYTD